MAETSLVPAKKKPRRKVSKVRRIHVEVVSDDDPVEAVKHAVHSVGEAVKAIRKVAKIVQPILDRVRGRKG